MSDQIYGRPEFLLGGAVSLSGAPHRPTLTPATPPPRPVTDEKSGETMRISANSPDVFEGPAPELGDTVEFVCVRADNRGWGLKLRVRTPTVES